MSRRARSWSRGRAAWPCRSSWWARRSWLVSTAADSSAFSGSEGMETVRCPDCDLEVSLPEGVRPGDRADCPHCAGLTLRLKGGPGAWTATIAHRVSCPSCDQAIVLPETSRPGDAIECCGRRWRPSNMGRWPQSRTVGRCLSRCADRQALPDFPPFGVIESGCAPSTLGMQAWTHEVAHTPGLRRPRAGSACWRWGRPHELARCDLNVRCTGPTS